MFLIGSKQPGLALEALIISKQSEYYIPQKKRKGGLVMKELVFAKIGTSTMHILCRQHDGPREGPIEQLLRQFYEIIQPSRNQVSAPTLINSPIQLCLPEPFDSLGPAITFSSSIPPETGRDQSLQSDKKLHHAVSRHRLDTLHTSHDLPKKKTPKERQSIPALGSTGWFWQRGKFIATVP